MNIHFAVGRYCSRISKEAEVEAELGLCLRTIRVSRGWGSALNSWSLAGRKSVGTGRHYGMVERLCDNECEGCEQP